MSRERADCQYCDETFSQDPKIEKAVQHTLIKRCFVRCRNDMMRLTACNDEKKHELIELRLRTIILRHDTHCRDKCLNDPGLFNR